MKNKKKKKSRGRIAHTFEGEHKKEAIFNLIHIPFAHSLLDK